MYIDPLILFAVIVLAINYHFRSLAKTAKAMKTPSFAKLGAEYATYMMSTNALERAMFFGLTTSEFYMSGKRTKESPATSEEIEKYLKKYSKLTLGQISGKLADLMSGDAEYLELQKELKNVISDRNEFAHSFWEPTLVDIMNDKNDPDALDHKVLKYRKIVVDKNNALFSSAISIITFFEKKLNDRGIYTQFAKDVFSKNWDIPEPIGENSSLIETLSYARKVRRNK